MKKIYYSLILLFAVLCFACTDDNSKTEPAVEVGKFKNGTFVLNEGNMTTENGSLIFISPKGEVTADAYKEVNGTELGNVTQDLFIANNKIYIISQNGSKNAVGAESENEGMLVVANAETLEKIAAYDEDISGTLSWPTHIAVLGKDNLYIRDNKGVYLFNTTTKDLTFVEGTNGALKNRMAVVDNKVFVGTNKKAVLVIEEGQTTVSHTIDMAAAVSGVVKSSDANLWISTSGKPSKIVKINPQDYSIIKQNEVTEVNLTAGVAASPAITAKGDIVYYSGLKTKIYRHDFNEGTTTLMVDAKTMVEDANIVYNTIAVHPLTGEVYMNTIKGYGWAFLENSISVFNFSGEEPKLSANYKDYTHFPIGVYFTYDFN